MKAPFSFESFSPLAPSSAILQAIDRINPNKLDSSNKNPQTHPGNAQIADLGSGEGTNWLLEHQFQTHPKDPIFIFMLLYRWSQDEQKGLVPKLFANTSEEVRYQDRLIPVYLCFHSSVEPVEVRTYFIIWS